MSLAIYWMYEYLLKTLYYSNTLQCIAGTVGVLAIVIVLTSLCTFMNIDTYSIQQ